MYQPRIRKLRNGVPILRNCEIDAHAEAFLHDYDADLQTMPQPVDIEAFAELYLGLSLDYVYLSHCGLILGRMVFQEVEPVPVFLPKEKQVDGKSYSAIHSVRGVLRPAFQMAVDDNILRKNPFEFMLVTVIVNDAVTREAITRKEERTFLNFIKNDKHYCKYYDGMYIFFKTGMRISEFTGLTIKDIDMVNRTINIDHQLQKTGTEVYIDTTKTYAGERVILMADDVYECFKRILKNRKPPKIEPIIDGYSGFLWFDKDEKPMVAMHWEKYFQHAVKKYNKIYKIQLPQITPHVCRHTYCSNMAKSGMNPKVLQYLMGHSDISVTLNTYTHLKLDDAREEMEALKAAEKEVRPIKNRLKQAKKKAA